MIRILTTTITTTALFAAVGSAQIPEQPGADKIAKLIERLGVEIDDTAAKVLEAGTPASKSASRKTALETARTRADDAIGTIDEILDAIPPCSSCSSSSCDSGLTGNPSGSKPKPGGNRPEKGQQKKPKANKPDPASPSSNQPAPPQLPQARERADHELAAGRWGDLPVQVRELFRNPDTDRLPPRYRRWIEDYYRRVRQPDSR